MSEKFPHTVAFHSRDNAESVQVGDADGLRADHIGAAAGFTMLDTCDGVPTRVMLVIAFDASVYERKGFHLHPAHIINMYEQFNAMVKNLCGDEVVEMAFLQAMFAGVPVDDDDNTLPELDAPAAEANDTPSVAVRAARKRRRGDVQH